MKDKIIEKQKNENQEDQDVRKQFKIEICSVNKLKPHPKNYVKHPHDQLDHIVRSIQEYGFYRNIIVSNDYVILAGHGVVEACKKIEKTEIPVYKVNFLSTDPRAMKIVVGDNEISHLREVDDRKLTDILKELSEYKPDFLCGTGYDEMMLANLVFVTRSESEIPDMNAAMEWANVGMPEHIEGENLLRINVIFRDEKAMEDFFAFLNIEKADRNGKRVNSLHWPIEREKDDKN